jgi:predicted O-methyltransferase YrrM
LVNSNKVLRVSLFNHSTHEKGNNPNYLDRSIELANSGALIVGNNVLQGGKVYDSSKVDLRNADMRAFKP